MEPLVVAAVAVKFSVVTVNHGDVVIIVAVVVELVGEEVVVVSAMVVAFAADVFEAVVGFHRRDGPETNDPRMT